MSENLELVRSTLAAWERADFHDLGWAHPEIEYTVVGGPDPGTWKGIEQMRASVRAFMGAWESYGIEAEEFRELDGERVLALVRLSGRGKLSGLSIEDMGAEGAEVWHMREGKVIRLALYWHRDQAFSDLGLCG